MLPALLVVAGLFCVLFLVRLGSARRVALVHRWPAILLATAAIVMLARGGVWPAIALGVGATVAWFAAPDFFSARNRPPPSQPGAEDSAAAEARALLGVRADATEAEIRSAYRAKMASAHPDRGGGHAQAARLTAARDLLLKRR